MSNKSDKALRRLGFEADSQIHTSSGGAMPPASPTFCAASDGKIWAIDQSGMLWVAKDLVDVAELTRIGFREEIMPVPTGHIPLSKNGEILH